MRDMVLARTLTLAGAVALATASVSKWFTYTYECGWTCYSPLSATERQDGTLHTFSPGGPSTAFDGLGTWVGVALVLVVAGALLAFGLAVAGRRVPRALAGLIAAGAATVVVRVVTQPGLGGLHVSNNEVGIQAAAYAGSAGAIAAAIGAVLLARRGRLESPVA
jgi:hypothetical protein